MGSRMLPGPEGTFASSSRTWLSERSSVSAGADPGITSMDGRPPPEQRALQAERLALVRKQALLKGRLEVVRRRNANAFGPSPANGRLGYAPAVRNLSNNERTLTAMSSLEWEDY